MDTVTWIDPAPLLTPLLFAHLSGALARKPEKATPPSVQPVHEGLRRKLPGKLLNLQEAAAQLGGVSVWTLRKHVIDGTLRVTRIGRRVLVPEEEIERIRREGLPKLHVLRPRRRKK